MLELIAVWLLIEFLSIPYGLYLAYKKERAQALFIAPLLVAAIPAAIGLIQTGIGAAQKAKAAKLARQNKRPELGDNPYTQEAIDLTRSLSNQGLSDSATQAYTTNADRGLASSINAILKSGGSANNIADLYDGNQSGVRSLALADQQAKMSNVNQFLNAGLKPGADQVRDQWFLNKYVPYKDTAALSASLSDQGMKDIWGGINTMGGAAANYFGSQAYEDKQQVYRQNRTDYNLASKLKNYRSSKMGTALPDVNVTAPPPSQYRSLTWNEQLKKWM